MFEQNLIEASASQHRKAFPSEFDFLVVGGGPAGNAAAIFLARASHSVCLLEASDYQRPRVGEHLSSRARRALDRHCLAHIVAQSGAIECPGVRSAWGTSEPYHRDYLFDAKGQGCHLDRPVFDELLMQHAQAEGATVLLKTKLDSVMRDGNIWRARVGNVRQINARFIIDASGRAASVARRLGARRIVFDSLFAVVTWFSSNAGADLTLLVEASENGWWYSMPVPGERLVCAFMTDADYLKSTLWRKEYPGTALLETTCHTKARARPAGPCSAPVFRQADSAMLNRIWGAGWLAVGDAAMSVDPLSSDGIARAIESGAAGANAAMDWLNGDKDALEQYAANQSEKFYSYLAQRTKIYSREKRWPDNPFWKQRHTNPASIFLSPQDFLVARKNALPGENIMGMKPSEIQKLCGLCQSGKPAHELVREFGRHIADISDEQIVFALQYLLMRGLLDQEAR